MMTQATNKTTTWLGMKFVLLLSGVLIAMPAATASKSMGAPAFQEQHSELTQLYVSQRNSTTPKVSLKVEHKPLLDVLHSIADELNVNISINTNSFQNILVTYSATDKYFYDVISDLIEGTNLEVTLSDNGETLILREKDTTEETTSDVMTGSVTGRVLDAETGEPLIGVTVLIRELNIGDATDIDGFYTIEDVPEGDYQLEISFIGYDTQRRTITVAEGETTELEIQLVVSTRVLDEVVVTAFGVERERRALGYSIQDVAAEDIGRSGTNNLLNALQGQVSGVQINRGGGGAGQGSQIFIRGFTSLDPGADNQPLFVVDGVPIDNSTIDNSSPGVGGRPRGMSNRAIDINPNDIESVSVLKSAPATALYGVRAANGAVIITTKRGQEGPLQIDFSHSISREDVINRPDYQDVYGPGFAFESAPDGFWPSWGAPFSETPELTYYNNWENSMRTAIGVNNSVSVSGGTESVTFFTSIANSNNRGVIPNNDWERTSIRVSGDFNQGPLSVSASANYINSGGSRVPFISFMERLAYWNTSADVNDWRFDDGRHKSDSRDGMGTGRNPVYDANINTYNDNVNRLIGNIRASYQLADWISLEYLVGLDTYSDERTDIEPGPLGLENEFIWSSVSLGFREETRINNRDLTSNIALNLQTDLSEDFGLSMRVGNDIFDRSTDLVRARGSGFVVPEFNHFSNATNLDIGQRMTQRRLIGLYGDLNVDWRNIIYLNITGRNDWTSTLPVENRSFFYPSVSLGYVFSDMFDMPDWITYSKLRFSYAEVGKDAPPYSTQSVFVAPSIFPLGGQTGFTRGATIASPELKPERTISNEIGLDFRFFNNRFGLDFTYYKANSKDMIIPVPVSNATGASRFRTNAGEIENKGFEITVRGTPIQSQQLQWNIISNFTMNRNEVVSIREGVEAIFLGNISAYINNPFMQLIPGESYGAIWGTNYARYEADPEDNKEDNKIDTSLPIIIGENGFPVVNNTPKIVGDATPDWTWNILNQFDYRNWDFSFNIDVVYGVDKYNKLDNWDAAFGHTTNTLNREDYVVFDGVLADGTPNTQEVWLGQGVDPQNGRDYGAGYHRNTYRVAVEESTEDASYVKLRSINLGYSLPQSVLENLPFTRARAGVAANNILLWTPFSQYDPEAFVSSGSNLVGLVDLAYPGTRSLVFSLNFSF